VLISDPGRWPFEDLCELLARKKGVECTEWQAEEPSPVSGTILSIQLS
jgi:hypothetical protein